MTYQPQPFKPGEAPPTKPAERRGPYVRTPAMCQSIRDRRIGQYLRVSAKDMTEPERAWVGAMVDAEGSVLQATSKRNGRIYWRLSVEMVGNGPEYMSAFLRLTGVGTIRYRTREQREHPFYTWGVWRYLDILSLAQQCALYSIKFQRVLKEGVDGKLSAPAF